MSSGNVSWLKKSEIMKKRTIYESNSSMTLQNPKSDKLPAKRKCPISISHVGTSVVLVFIVQFSIKVLLKCAVTINYVFNSSLLQGNHA